MREPAASPQESTLMKPKTRDEGELVKIVETKPKKEKAPPRVKRQERSRHARPEVVLIKPLKGLSYDEILMDLKERINPEKLGATAQGIRETHSEDFLMEKRCAMEDI